MKIYRLLLLTLLISACASTPVPINKAIQAPAERVLAFQTQTSDKVAILAVVRDDGPARCFAGLYINEVLAARLDVAEVARFFIEPGDVLLRVGWDPQGVGFCFSNDWTQRETILKPGEQKSFRMTHDVNGRWDIFRLDTNHPK